MLVLGRKENERLIIDGKIVVTVVRASNGNVRLGIDAPAYISIKREELLEAPHPNHRQTRAADSV
jgi:carbon storage regulator